MDTLNWCIFSRKMDDDGCIKQYVDVFVDKGRDYEKEMAIPHFVGLNTFSEIIPDGVELLLRTDNKHVEGVMISKISADLFLQSVIRWVSMFVYKKRLRTYIKYVNTKCYGPADALSRFNLDLFKRRTVGDMVVKGGLCPLVPMFDL